MVQRLISATKHLLIIGAMVGGLTASASAVTIGFDSDTTGFKPNGFQSVDSPTASFSGLEGGLFSVSAGSSFSLSGATGQVLAVRPGIIISFAAPVSTLSIQFGNDDTALPEGTNAVLTVFLQGQQVGQSTLPVNRNILLDQTIFSPAVSFDQATLRFDKGTLPLFIIDNVTFSTNTPPTADAGPDQTVEVSGATTPVTLNGSGSSDPDGDTLTYTWSESGALLGSGAILPVNLTPGTHAITLAVMDPQGASTTDDIVVNVLYSHTDVLQPVNADGTSVFKLGRTVPVKFRLTGASGGLSDLTARFSAVHVGSDAEGEVNEPEAYSEASAGDLFRYDPGSDQYIFNWSTRALPSGRYEVHIDLGDGQEFTVDVCLK